MNTISWQRCDTLLLLFLVFLFHFLRQSLLQPCQVELASTIQEKQWVPPIMPFFGAIFHRGSFFVAKDVDSNIWYWYRCICKDVYMEGKYIVIICIRLYFAHDLLLPLKFEMSAQMFLQVFCQCPGDCDTLFLRYYDRRLSQFLCEDISNLHLSHLKLPAFPLHVSLRLKGPVRVFRHWWTTIHVTPPHHGY